MSLVLAVYSDSFGVIASDGRAISPLDGTPVCEDSFKMQPLSESIVLGATGTRLLTAKLRQQSWDLARTYAGEPRELFSHLVCDIPRLAGDILAAVAGDRNLSTEAAAVGAKLELAAILVGYDPQSSRVRCLAWSSLDGFRAQPEDRDDINYRTIGTGAIGAQATEKACALIRAYREECKTLPPIGVLCQIVRDVFREQAKESREINSHCQIHVVSDPAVADHALPPILAPFAKEAGARVGAHAGILRGRAFAH